MSTRRQLLRNEQGVTLIETMVTILVTVAAFLGLYIGILYSEKQIERDNHDRVAALIASGALEELRYSRAVNGGGIVFSNQSIVIDPGKDGKGKILGVLSRVIKSESEIFQGQPRNYTVVEIHVSWKEPRDVKNRDMVVREDFYTIPK